MKLQERIAIFQQFGRTYRAFMTAFESRVGLPLPRWRILLALYDHARLVEQGTGAACRDDAPHSGPNLSQKRLVERLSIDPGALTRQLKQLEKPRVDRSQYRRAGQPVDQCRADGRGASGRRARAAAPQRVSCKCARGVVRRCAACARGSAQGHRALRDAWRAASPGRARRHACHRMTRKTSR